MCFHDEQEDANYEPAGSVTTTVRQASTSPASSKTISSIFKDYRHALRVSELVLLCWDQVDMGKGLLHVVRRQNGVDSTDPVRGPEIRALRRLQQDYLDTSYVFVTERGGSLTDSIFRKLVARAGRKVSIKFPVHPQMLRHGCGFKLANDGQDTRAIQHCMGHWKIPHIVRYTELASGRFNIFFKY